MGSGRIAGQNKNAAQKGGVSAFSEETGLLDLGFLELDVLLGDRIVFAKRQLVRLGAAVLAGHVEETGVGGRQKLDLDVCGFGHCISPLCSWGFGRWSGGKHPDAGNLARHIKNVPGKSSPAHQLVVSTRVVRIR